jgi:ATP/maltotriose-dependent transcriptional regulator MalT/DNA-binding SARP family transcriptional activator
LSNIGPTLIRSKLLVPSPTGLLHRSRLCQTLEQGLDRKLALVSAPAGYGKTSALVDFAQTASIPVCWYTVDERDRDLNLFVRYLVAAIGERFSGFGEQTREALEARAGDLFREPTAVVGDLVNEMLDVDQDFVLVLDNFEVLDGAFGIEEFTRRFVEVLPPNCHLMIGSRVLPDVPVTQLVAKRQLVGVTEQHLRFKPDEIRELLARSQIEVSEAQARAIANNAEGWITGVLLILDLLREDAASAFVDAAQATSQTYAYLAFDVLSRQPPDVRRFLHTSSVLREMSTRLCREVLNIDRAKSLLLEVERRNLFLTRFGDSTGSAYRYHNLFRDFLQDRLREDEPALYAELHRRAGTWFERQHDVEEAVYHYLAAEAYPEATALMERVAMEWFHRGRLETLSRWAESLPEQIRRRAPRLQLYHGKALTDRYEYERARDALAFAEAGFVERKDSTRLARVHNQKATLALFEGRYEDVIEEANVALEMLDHQENSERAQAQRMIGRADIGLGRFAQGVAELQKALGLYRQIDSPYDVLNLLQDLAFAFTSQGRFDEAAAYLGEALPLARRLGSPTQLAGVLNSLGWIRDVRGEHREALKLYEEGLAAARRGDDPRSQANIAEGMATVYRNIGDYRRAEFLYDVAWRIAREGRPVLAVLILVGRADMYRWQGDHGRALTLLEQARRLAEERGLDTEKSGLLRVAEGIALVEKGSTERGFRLLSNGISFLGDQGAKRDLARGHFLCAKARLLAGQERQAVVELRRALGLAKEMGTSQFAAVEGQHAPELLELGVSEGLTACRGIMEQARSMSFLGEELVQDGLEEREVPEAHLEIYALGEGRVVRDGRPVSSSEWRAAMAKELFFYILLHGPVERDAIGLVFWPDLPAEKVTNNFHSTLYRVRKAVGGDAVVVEGGKYTLGVDYWFDVQEFETLTERARLLPPHDWQAQELWRRAVELYKGDFLPEVERAWCVPKREQVRNQYIEALIESARCREARGAVDEAVAWYRRALEEDELREDVHRRIMRVYAEAGRRSAALAQYRDCRKTLKQELGVEPSRETQRLYEEVAGRMAG